MFKLEFYPNFPYYLRNDKENFRYFYNLKSNLEFNYYFYKKRWYVTGNSLSVNLEYLRLRLDKLNIEPY